MRKIFSYLRYDTLAELGIINDLYRGDLSLYNPSWEGLQSVIKLVSKEKIGGSLNPAQLKRSIDAKLDGLYHTYEEKGRSPPVNPMKKVIPYDD